LFLNIEPMALDTECPADVRREIDAAYSNCQIVLEVTERSLDRDPCSLLVGVDRIRETAQGLAIDDVGANARTLSMLTLLEPELVKLDFGIVHAGPSPDVVRTLDCVYADSERRRAIVLAEGIETAEQANLARSMGATLGQGRYFGWPGPLPTNLPRPREPVQIQPQKLLTANRPFDAAQGLQSRRATASLLAPLGARVGHCSVDIYNSAALVALLPNAELYDAADKDHFEDLARQGVLTGVIGPGVSTEPGEGVRGGHVDLDDTELNGQWAVVGISSHSATAMLAREIPGSSSEFEFVLTHDRERVAAAARCLLRYIHPVDDATELT
jgi:EAL domain